MLSPVAIARRRAPPAVSGAARRTGRPDGPGLVQRCGGGAQREFDEGSAARDFRAAVAFYPNCTRKYPGGPEFRPYAPLYVLVGALDDWTPAGPCMALVERARAAGAPIAIKVYPGAHHAFDAPSTPIRYRPEVKNHSKQNGDSGATVGTDPAARADAIAEVAGFLAAQLAAPPTRAAPRVP
jgi:dienelactone hydrolase